MAAISFLVIDLYFNITITIYYLIIFNEDPVLQAKIERGRRERTRKQCTNMKRKKAKSE